MVPFFGLLWINPWRFSPVQSWRTCQTLVGSNFCRFGFSGLFNFRYCKQLAMFSRCKALLWAWVSVGGITKFWVTIHDGKDNKLVRWVFSNYLNLVLFATSLLKETLFQIKLICEKLCFMTPELNWVRHRRKPRSFGRCDGICDPKCLLCTSAISKDSNLSTITKESVVIGEFWE